MWQHLPMAAEDDPEQRIRDLERSLSERASELGVDTPAPTYVPPQDAYPPPPPGAGYRIPPPPPPGVYPPPPSLTFGTPYPQASSRSFGLGWLLIAVPLVGLVIAGISFAVFFNAAGNVTSQFSSMPSVRPPAPTNGSTGGASSAPRTVATGGTVSVSGVSKHEVLACDGGTVNVSGVTNTVEISGHCDNVIVSGVENTVKVESSDAINASGFTNRVTFSSGTPRTSSSGDNVIAPG
jgi:hypothetical protein